jgi:transketolase
VLAEAEGGERQVTLIGTGSETSLAMAARDLLASRGVRAAVVSMPCWSLFDRQTASYRRAVLGGPRVAKVAVEAALGFGWDRYLGAKGAFVGMTGFGASAPAPELYRHFGITPEAVAEAATALL